MQSLYIFCLFLDQIPLYYKTYTEIANFHVYKQFPIPNNLIKTCSLFCTHK